jgi:hypothetical protein
VLVYVKYDIKIHILSVRMIGNGLVIIMLKIILDYIKTWNYEDYYNLKIYINKSEDFHIKCIL